MSLGPVDNDIGLHGRPTLMRQVSKFVNSAGNNASVNVLMIGSGEYTTGYVNGQASDSDKGAGVGALVYPADHIVRVDGWRCSGGYG